MIDIIDMLAYSSFAIGLIATFSLLIWPERKSQSVDRVYDIHFRF